MTPRFLSSCGQAFIIPSSGMWAGPVNMMELSLVRLCCILWLYFSRFKRESLAFKKLVSILWKDHVAGTWSYLQELWEVSAGSWEKKRDFILIIEELNSANNLRCKNSPGLQMRLTIMMIQITDASISTWADEISKLCPNAKPTKIF